MTATTTTRPHMDKLTASVAACLTILSYVATAVVSAVEAVKYLQYDIWPACDPTLATIALLAFFALCMCLGLSESAYVAMAIFITHILTLVALCGASVWRLSMGSNHFVENWHSPQPNIGLALVRGFSAGALGISGFESSANFIQEMRVGVFPKVLRNLWICAMLCNPVLSTLSLGLMPLSEVRAHKSVVLLRMAEIAGGPWLAYWVAADAFLVLAGAVLTAYVGVVGLTKRLAGDNCLPSVLLVENKWRGTCHWIILLFFAVCTSMTLALKNDIMKLSGVYALAFLAVMALFAVGDMLLKYKRDSLPRPYRVPWPSLVLALVAVLFALAVTVARKPRTVVWFALYLGVTMGVFLVTFFRVPLLTLCLHCLRYCLRGTPCAPDLDRALVRAITSVRRATACAFFTKTAKLSVLNKAIRYIRENEFADWVRIVHVSPDPEWPLLQANIAILDEMYPKVRIDCVLLQGAFGAAAIDTVSQAYGIPHNLLFITAPGANFRHRLCALGGVRIITHHVTDDEWPGTPRVLAIAQAQGGRGGEQEGPEDEEGVLPIN